MRYGDYILASMKYYRNHRNMGMRRGQAYMNMLTQKRPDLQQGVADEKLDVFYTDDEREIVNFLIWVGDNWEGESK